MASSASSPRFEVSGRAVVAVALWGVSFVAVRVALQSFTPAGLVSTRMLAAAVLLGLLLVSRGETLLPRREDRLRCGLLGLILGVHVLVQAIGLQYTSAVNTGWMVSVNPVFIALGAALFLRQPLRPMGWVGAALATIGVLLVTASTPADFADATLGDMLQLGSCLTWTTYTLVAPAALARNGSLRVTTFAMGIAGALVAVVAAFTGFVAAPLTGEVMTAWVVLAVLCSAAAYLLWSLALESHGPTRTGAVLYVEPLFTLLAAAMVLGEPLGSGTLAGGGLVLVGTWVVGRAAASKRGDAG